MQVKKQKYMYQFNEHMFMDIPSCYIWQSILLVLFQVQVPAAAAVVVAAAAVAAVDQALSLAQVRTPLWSFHKFNTVSHDIISSHKPSLSRYSSHIPSLSRYPSPLPLYHAIPPLSLSITLSLPSPFI